VLGGIVAAHDLLGLNDAGAVLVDDVEGLVDEVQAALGEGVPHALDELLEGDRAAVVRVEVIEEHPDLWVREAHLELLHSLLELAHGQRLGAVVVHDAELALEADEAVRSVRLHLLLELSDEHAHAGVRDRGVSCAKEEEEEE
jgi:hypothetical protein